MKLAKNVGLSGSLHTESWTDVEKVTQVMSTKLPGPNGDANPATDLFGPTGADDKEAAIEQRQIAESEKKNLLIRGYPESFTNPRSQGRARIRIGLDIRPAFRRLDFDDEHWERCFTPYAGARDAIKSCEVYRTATGKQIAEIPLNRPTELRFEGMRTPDSTSDTYTHHVDVDIAGLEDGCYHLLVKAENGTRCEAINFLVRGDIGDMRGRKNLIVYPTFTLQAYNHTGGHSYYLPLQREWPGMRRISLRRPLGAALSALHQVGVSAAVERAVAACELDYSVTDNLDMHLHPEILDDMNVVIVTGHDEYITHRIRTAIETFVERGGNLLILSGNTFDAQVTYDGELLAYMDKVGRLMDMNPDAAQRTGRYADPNLNRAVDPLIGLAWRFGGFPPSREMTPERAEAFGVSAEDFANAAGVWVDKPEHPIFAGLGLKRMAVVGADNKVQDLEIDGIPLSRTIGVDLEKAPSALHHTKVLGYSIVQQWVGAMPLLRRHPRLRAVGTVVEHRVPNEDGRPQGGLVLNFGSPGWSRAADKPSVAGGIVRNAIAYLNKLTPARTRERTDGFEPLEADYPAKPAATGTRTLAGTVLLKGMSRTGTTMMNALLDAHPGIAMCYDVIPKPWVAEVKTVVSALAEAVQTVGVAECQDINDLTAFKALQKRIESYPFGANLNYLLMACRRSSIPPFNVLGALQEIGTPEIRTPIECLQAAKVLLAARLKIAQRAAPEGQFPVMTGMKASFNMTHLLNEFPEGRIVLLVRDPRDVAVSHLKRKWAEEVQPVAKTWKATYGTAITIAAAHHDRVLPIRYEDVVSDPSIHLPEMCAFLGIERLALHEVLRSNASVFGVAQAFNENVQEWWGSGLTTNRLGSWRDSLSPTQIKDIEDVCSPIMEHFGYRCFFGG